MVDDIEKLVNKYGVNALSINDSNFFVNETRVQEICEGIIKSLSQSKYENIKNMIGKEKKWKAKIKFV